MSTGNDWCNLPFIFFFLFQFLVHCIAQSFFSIVLYLKIVFTMFFVVVVNLNIFWLKSKLPWRFWSLMFFNQCRRRFCSKTHWAVYVGTILRHHRCKGSFKFCSLIFGQILQQHCTHLEHWMPSHNAMQWAWLSRWHMKHIHIIHLKPKC